MPPAPWKVLDALLPCPCVLCGAQGDEALCPPCREQFFGVAEARCPVCAEPLPPGSDGALCGKCVVRRPAFDATFAAASYAMPLDRLVLDLKFGGQLAHAALFATLLADAARRHPGFVVPEVLCPVPLGPARLAERGFNQALEIARPLGRLLGVPVLPSLAMRVQETSAQSKLHGARRRANVSHVFAVPERAAVEGRHVGVVDDVMSTGQTLGELAATFKRHGAARVTNLVFARTPPRHGI